MFLGKDPRRQPFFGVIVEYRHGSLNHDRTRIQIVGNEIHRDAADFHAVRQRLMLRVKSGKRR
jgi:hypothetical protein